MLVFCLPCFCFYEKGAAIPIWETGRGEGLFLSALYRCKDNTITRRLSFGKRDTQTLHSLVGQVDSLGLPNWAQCFSSLKVPTG